MGKHAKPGFRHRLRKIYRRTRILAWTVLAVVILSLLYLNQVGLPGFVKRPLLEKLHAHGVELQFKNLRLSWYRGFVAYDVRFGRTEDVAAPWLTAERVQIPLDATKLRHLEFQIGGLIMYNARLAWPLAGTNDFALEHIYGELRFLPGDEWQLVHLEAQLADARIGIIGSLTNASAMRNWTIFKGGRTNAPTSPEKKLEQIQRIANMIGQLKFAEPPEIRADFSGDARGKEPFRLGIRSQLGGGVLNAQAAMNPDSREVTFVARSDFDLQKIRPLLPAKADVWLGRFSWTKPPQIRILGSAIFPVGTNGLPDLRHEVLPTLRLDGEFKVGRAAFRDVPILAARSRLLYTDQTWQLPDLLVTRPEGEVHISHWTRETDHDYYWHIRGAFDLKAVRPLVDAPVQKGLDLVEFTTPPKIDVEVWSRWFERERTGVKGHVLVSNVTFRGESASTIETDLEYTNLWLHLGQPVITRGEHERGTLSSVDVNFRDKMLYLSNGVSTVDPGVVTRAIGPKVAHAVEAYQFLSPPTGHIEGSVCCTNAKIADLRVDLAGGPFHWMKFTVPYIAGNIVWSNHNLLLTNVASDFYGGKLEGNAGFDFSPPVGDDFHFNIYANDADLSQLVPDLSKGTNTHQLAGKLSGRVIVTWANSRDFQSWQGFGDMTLHDGQLWEIPVFGIFAPVLDVLYPNLGSGRASDGTATFAITNSVIYTANLELRSPTMRIQYHGTVDFDGKLNARAESELLRNTAVIGPLVSTVFWPVTKLLEYKIAGTLAKPAVQPVYIPKMFLFPFHPIQSLRSMMIDDSRTNAPSAAMGPATDSGAKTPE